MKNLCRGFTLLELLIAIAVFAVVALLSYDGLDTVLNSERHAEARAEELRRLQSAMLILQQDLSQLSKRPIRDEFGSEVAAFTSADYGKALIEFTRGGRPNPAGLKRSALLRVGYGLEDETLTRYVWAHADRASGAEPYPIPLLDAVRSFKSRFLDSNGEWHDNWPPLETVSGTAGTGVAGGTAGEESGETLLPHGVEITLEVEGWDVIRRIFNTTVEVTERE